MADGGAHDTLAIDRAPTDNVAVPCPAPHCAGATTAFGMLCVRVNPGMAPPTCSVQRVGLCGKSGIASGVQSAGPEKLYTVYIWLWGNPKGVNRLRSDIEGIRHAAVHRQRLSHRRLQQQLSSAREFARLWLGDQHCGTEIEQCQGRVNHLFSAWKGRTRRLRGNLAAHMARNQTPEGHHHLRLLLEVARRVLEKINHDCNEQVDHILQLSFPSLPTI